MNVTLEFNDEQAREIEEAAKRLGLPVEQFVKGAVLRIVGDGAREFDAAAEYVLRKNEALYKRLA